MPPRARTVWSLTKQTLSDFNQDNAMRLAAAMACYIMLALAPMLVIFVKMLGWRYGEDTNTVVRGQLEQLIGPSGGEAIGQMIENAHKQGGGTVATIVSFIIVAVSASGVFISLQDALNTIWEVKPSPNAGWWQWVRKRFLSIGMVFGIAILLLSSMTVTAVLGQMIDGIFGADRTGVLAKAGAYVADFVITIAIVWVMLMGVFKFLPDVKIAWNDVWLGALVTAVLFKLGQIGMALYFNYGSTTSAYGTFGSIVAVLLWAYYSSAILFIGAEFTQVWAAAHGRGLEPEDHAVKVTEQERAQQGMPNSARVAAAERAKVAPPARPIVSAPQAAFIRKPAPNRAVVTGGAAAVGAAVAAIATWYLSRRPLPADVAARVKAVEAKVGRVSRLKDLLGEIDVQDRINRLDHTIRRAGTHVRAEETHRPKWMVRVADAIGGRWSNL